MTKNYTAKQFERDSFRSIDRDYAGCMPNEGNKMNINTKISMIKGALIDALECEKQFPGEFSIVRNYEHGRVRGLIAALYFLSDYDDASAFEHDLMKEIGKLL